MKNLFFYTYILHIKKRKASCQKITTCLLAENNYLISENDRKVFSIKKI